MNKDKVRQAIVGMRVLSPLKTDLRSKIADILLDIGVPQRVAVRTTLFRAGDLTNDVGVLVVSGELDVEKEGQPPITAYAPDLIGEMAQLNPTRQRTATVTAATELEVLRFNWPAFTSSARSRLTDEEINAFTAALQEHAWAHFMS